MVRASDRLGRGVSYFLGVLDEPNRLNSKFVGFHKQLGSGGALGRAVATIISTVAELERSLGAWTKNLVGIELASPARGKTVVVYAAGCSPAHALRSRRELRFPQANCHFVYIK